MRFYIFAIADHGLVPQFREGEPTWATEEAQTPLMAVHGWNVYLHENDCSTVEAIWIAVPCEHVTVVQHPGIAIESTAIDLIVELSPSKER